MQPNIKRIILLTIFIGSTFLHLSCEKPQTAHSNAEQIRTIEQQLDTTYSAIQGQHFSAPQISDLTLPAPNKFSVIWGATGKDDKGNIYIT